MNSLKNMQITKKKNYSTTHKNINIDLPFCNWWNPWVSDLTQLYQIWSAEIQNKKTNQSKITLKIRKAI